MSPRSERPDAAAVTSALAFFAPATLEERLTIYVTRLRDAAETSSRRGALPTALVLRRVAGELDEILADAGRDE